MKDFRKIAQNEFVENCECVSDIDNSYNVLTGEFDVPAVEWESPYGSYWKRYNSELERTAALNIHNENRREWIRNRTRELEREHAAKVANYKASANTIGNLFPKLAKLAR